MKKIYKGGAQPTRLTVAFTETSPANGEEVHVENAIHYPFDDYFVISLGHDRTLPDGTAAEEKLLVTRMDGSNILSLHPTLGRGFDDTPASTHPVGEKVEHVLDADSLSDFSAHVYDTSRDDHTQYYNSARHLAAHGGTLHSLDDFQLTNYLLTTALGATGYTYITVPAVASRAIIWRFRIDAPSTNNWAFQVWSEPAGAGELMFEAVGIGLTYYNCSWTWIYENQDTPQTSNFYIALRNIAVTPSDFTLTDLRGVVFT